MKATIVAILLTATAASAQQIAPERFPVASNNAPLTWNTGPYSYDAAGNVSAIGSQYFLYDTTGRLGTAHMVTLNASATQSYSYDPYGNLTSLTGYGPDESLPSSTSTNHLDPANAEYDSGGNLRKWLSRENVVYNYGYDSAGMMTTLSIGTGPNPYTVTYIYGADDQRVMTADLSANDSHVTIRDLAGAVLTDLELKGTTWSHRRDYVYRGGAMSAATSPGGVQYFSLDHLGSPRLVTDDAGYVLAFETFLPFGQELGQPVFNDGAVKKFTSHERDFDPAGMGNVLDYMHARYYNGETGRFLSVDPVLGNLLRPQSWNRYAYALNNPLRYTDPAGLAEREGITIYPEPDPGDPWRGERQSGSIHDFFMFLSGAQNAAVTDNLGTIGRVDVDDDWYRRGQLVGDGIALVQGFYETEAGFAGEAGGFLLDLSGAGVFIGVPAQVVSGAAVVHGTATGLIGGYHLMANLNKGTATQLGRSAATAGGRAGSAGLQSLAQMLGFKVVSGGNHLTVVDSQGKVITQIPHSLKGFGTAMSIAKSMIKAAGL